MSNGNVDVVNSTREDVGDIKHRKRLSTLTDAELRALREGIQAMKEVTDDRGFGHYGSIHGMGGPAFCEHSSQLFLPWHRAYLYFMELDLQRVAPGVTLPWWDYPAQPGLPPAYGDEELPDGRPNPLFDAEIVMADGFRQPDWPERTFRNPGDGVLPSQDDLDGLAGFTTFDRFTFALEQLHNGVHRWVGGTMRSQQFAGWDPVFWAHHCMIDRAWALWQNGPTGADPRQQHLSKGLNYFPDLVVRDTLLVTDLGYDYAAAEVLGETDPDAPGTTPRTFATEPLAAGFDHADIELHKVDQVVPSFEARIFAGNPEADADTPLEPRSGYLTSFHVFGKQECWGGEGHCHEIERGRFDRRRQPQVRAKVVVQVPVERLRPHLSEPELTVRVVPVLGEEDRDHRPEEVLKYERISLVAYD